MKNNKNKNKSMKNNKNKNKLINRIRINKIKKIGVAQWGELIVHRSNKKSKNKNNNLSDFEVFGLRLRVKTQEEIFSFSLIENAH